MSLVCVIIFWCDLMGGMWCGGRSGTGCRQDNRAKIKTPRTTKDTGPPPRDPSHDGVQEASELTTDWQLFAARNIAPC